MRIMTLSSISIPQAWPLHEFYLSTKLDFGSVPGILEKSRTDCIKKYQVVNFFFFFFFYQKKILHVIILLKRALFLFIIFLKQY